MSDEWQLIESAPTTSPYDDPATILVWVSDGGHRNGTVAFGRCYRGHDGSIRAQATGFYGNWSITHWMPLPDPPKEQKATAD